MTGEQTHSGVQERSFISYLRHYVVFIFHSIWDNWQEVFFAKGPKGKHLKELTNLQLIFLPRAFERVKNVVWKCFIK